MRINRQLVNDASIADNPEATRVKVDKYELTEKPPKKNSYRTLKIPKIVVEEVKRRKRKQEECKKTYKDFIDYNYISFQEKTGLPHIPNSFNSFLYKLCPKIGISNISVHGLRHTFATILIEQGVPIIKISALLGHSSTMITFENYTDKNEIIQDCLEDLEPFIERVVETDKIKVTDCTDIETDTIMQEYYEYLAS